MTLPSSIIDSFSPRENEELSKEHEDEEQDEEHQIERGGDYEGRSKSLVRGEVILVENSDPLDEEQDENILIEQDSDYEDRSETQIPLGKMDEQQSVNEVQICNDSETQIETEERGETPLELCSLESEKVNGSFDDDCWQVVRRRLASSLAAVDVGQLVASNAAARK